MTPGRNYSRKREAILQLIRGTKIHPSAEWIYAQLKPEFADLSLGTVYRNLNLFRETGEILSIANVKGQERYDGNTRPHPHFICRCCGAVIDVETLTPGRELDGKLAESTGFQVDYHDLIFHGRCEACVSQQAG